MKMIVGMALKFYAINAKGLKLKLKKFLGLILMFVAVMGGRLVWGGGVGGVGRLFGSPHPE